MENLKIRKFDEKFLETVSFEILYPVSTYNWKQEIDRNCFHCNKNKKYMMVTKHNIRMQEGYDIFNDINFYCRNCLKSKIHPTKFILMENKFKNTGSALDHCRNCKSKLFEWEEDAALCGNCIFEFVEDTKKENVDFFNQLYK